MHSNVNRRQFIQKSVFLAGGVSLFSPLAGLYAQQQNDNSVSSSLAYGPLSPVKDITTNLPLLKLPRGFCYQSFGWTADAMGDGSMTPARHDGMAVVSSYDQCWNELVLIRNHENGVQTEGDLPPIRGAAAVYDDWYSTDLGIVGFGGGASAVFFKRGRFVASQAVLGGTAANCAGGPTPWGSWLSCEETRLRGHLLGAKDHGYVFEVPNPRVSSASAQPIKGMGFMKHEAVAIDPNSGYVYLTEDNGPHSGVYRYRPANSSPEIGALEQGGTLEMLRVSNQNNVDLRNVTMGDQFVVDWVPIEDPDADSEWMVSPAPGLPPIEGAGKSGPYLQGEAQGGAQFYRMEGCWYQERVIYMTDTGAGPAHKGVVWALQPGAIASGDFDLLTVLYASPHEQIMDAPDNITVNERGGILICEDGGGHINSEGMKRGTRLIGVERNGTSFEFAENIMALTGPIPGHEQIPVDDYTGKEFCGACFDPTGRYLFVNVQTPGVTFVISGPWKRGSL